VMRSEDINFSEKGVDEVFKKVILRLQNVLAFYELYPDMSESTQAEASQHVLDRWLVARLAEVTNQVTEAMEAYQIDNASRVIESFIDDLSVWYVRRSRDRMRSDLTNNGATQTLRRVLKGLAKLLAPFTPFLAEKVFAVVKNNLDPESVHLADWPLVQKSDFERALLDEMATIRKLVELGHAERSSAGIKVRQPLAKATITGLHITDNDLTQILCEELNVREFDWQSMGELGIILETEITPDLKKEGIERELVRLIQSLRKKKGLDVAAVVTAGWATSEPDFEKFFRQSKYLKRLETTMFQEEPGLTEGKVAIDGRTLYLVIKD